MKNFKKSPYPLFFGAGNVTELIDADSVGVNALLAGLAMEVGAAVIFTSEHSDKTAGSISEMRRATEMMALAKDRPYPKDLGIDLLVLKEKRRRREPPVEYETITAAKKMPENITFDPKGNFRITTSSSHSPSGFVTILHPTHPLCGQQVELIRIRRGTDPDLIVRLPDGHHAAIAMR